MSLTAADIARTLVLPDVLLVEDLAGAFRRSPASVRALLRAGALPGSKLGRRWVVERGALLRRLNEPALPSRLRVVPPPRDKEVVRALHGQKGGSP